MRNLLHKHQNLLEVRAGARGGNTQTRAATLGFCLCVAAAVKYPEVEVSLHRQIAIVCSKQVFHDAFKLDWSCLSTFALISMIVHSVIWARVILG
jgi:hypothetical protein